jgi:outer membrane receptor protein involved in Fe transport
LGASLRKNHGYFRLDLRILYVQIQNFPILHRIVTQLLPMKSPVLLGIVLFFSYIELCAQGVTKDTTAPNNTEKIGEVTIKQNRLKEKLKESPLTVESMGAQSIRETPASDFYEALGHLKGVDVTSASLGFRIVNTRGFNSTSPVRTLQVIDGVDNQSPGLNFSLGNFLGASELDVVNQEIVVGASSAYYGPGAFNGVISMTTKDPFKYQGLQVKQKIAERGLTETAVRYAKAFGGKPGQEKWAMKANLFYMRAYDWEADNMDAVKSGGPLDSVNNFLNPGRYDAVNRYGDEILRPGENDATARSQKWDYPGLMRFHRQGYEEKDIVDYNTYNFKTSFMTAYRPKPTGMRQFEYQVNYGMGTTVYQGDNRYSLRDIKFIQNRLEYKDKNGFLRVYATHEDAGKTYDAVFTALLMQKAAKRDDLWGGDYYSLWKSKFVPQLKKLPGYPTGDWLSNPNWFTELDALMANNQELLTKWHQECAGLADRKNDWQGRPHFEQPNTYDRFQPGTDRYDSLKNAITSLKSFGEGGSGFFDKSALYHIQGEHKFKLADKTNLTTGFSGRLYRPNSMGTIFSDTNGRVIRNHEFGAYAGIEQRSSNNKLKINATARVDKNQNFNYIFSPAASLVYTPDKITYYRVSLSAGVRNPTLADQYLYYNVGRAILLGNITGYDSMVTLPSLYEALSGLTTDLKKLQWFGVDPVRPEKVKSIEIGYKSFLASNKLNIDASAYYSFYEDFIGYNIGIDPTIDYTINYISGGQVYRIATNAESTVTTMGVSIGTNYFFAKNYTAGVNYSFNQLNKTDNLDPIIPAFNTPKNKFNLSLSGQNLEIKKLKLENLGFSINYKWIQGFRFEGSPQFTGDVPTYYLLDVMVSKVIPKYKAMIKMGASNITNNMVMQVYGGPRIGRMAYFSMYFDL